MTDTGNLAAALAAFQAEMPTVTKSQKAEVPTKSGGKYTYTYAGLADVTEAAMPLLSKHGLSFSACPKRTDHGDYELVGILLHKSGEQLTGALPIQGRAAQEIGSSITYGRRYLFGCMTGLVTDDDDDGALANGSQQRPTARRQTSQQQGGGPAPQQGGTRAASEAQLRMLGALMSEAGMTNRELALAFVADVIGREVASRNELTSREASAVIDRLQKEQGGSPA